MDWQKYIQNIYLYGDGLGWLASYFTFGRFSFWIVCMLKGEMSDWKTTVQHDAKCCGKENNKTKLFFIIDSIEAYAVSNHHEDKINWPIRCFDKISIFSTSTKFLLTNKMLRLLFSNFYFFNFDSFSSFFNRKFVEIVMSDMTRLPFKALSVCPKLRILYN